MKLTFLKNSISIGIAITIICCICGSAMAQKPLVLGDTSSEQTIVPSVMIESLSKFSKNLKDKIVALLGAVGTTKQKEKAWEQLYYKNSGDGGFFCLEMEILFGQQVKYETAKEKRKHNQSVFASSLQQQGNKRFDNDVQLPGTNFYWQRCPLGQSWDGYKCHGKKKSFTWKQAITACPKGYRLPSVFEYIWLTEGEVDKYDKKAIQRNAESITARGCAKGRDTCAQMFGTNLTWYWTKTNHTCRKAKYAKKCIKYGEAYMMSFNHLALKNTSKSDLLHVRCLRGKK